MVVFIWLLLWNVGWSMAETAQPSYDSSKAEIINKPEPEAQYAIPKLSTGFDHLGDDARFIIHLFSGKAEFPFVVTIKANDYAPCQDPSDSIYREAQGILIASDIVMTACKPVSYTTCEDDNTDHFKEWPDDNYPLPNPALPLFPSAQTSNVKKALCPSEKLTITALAPNILDVKYATLFLIEENRYTDDRGYFVKDRRGLLHGVRHVFEVILHPSCKPWETLDNDVALLFLTAPILPFGKWIGFPTFPLDGDGNIEQTQLNNKNFLCYVSGFQNEYRGLHRGYHLTQHYKVKFRSYQTSMATCIQYTKIICFEKDLTITRGCWDYLRTFVLLNAEEMQARGIECWETRNKIGTVCNQHAGGPLVCDGITHGFVIRAADHERCNIHYRLPFFVTRIYPFQMFFNILANQGRIPYNPINTRPGERPPDFERSYSSRQPINGILQLMWAFSCTVRVFSKFLL